MSDVSSELSSNPGRILKAAREELKLSIDQIADELHLRSAVVEAMENENYEAFTGDVFLKGYFRSYCRLVNLHEQRMVEILDEQLANRQEEIDTVALNLHKLKQTKARKKAIAALVLGLAIAALGLYIISTMFGVERSKDSHPDAPGSANMRPEADKVAIPGIATDQGMQEELVAEALEPSDQGSSEDDVSAMPLQESPAELPESTVEAVDETTDTRSSEPDVQVAGDSALFQATFSGDCWFKLVDANNKTIFAALKRANDTVSYSGLTPFRIVLGDASKVSLSLNGSAVDLQPFTARNGRAALTLGEET